MLLRNISMLWSLFHSLIMFLMLFEPRYSKKKTVIVSLAAMVPLFAINFVLFLWVGADRFGAVSLISLTLPSVIIFWFLAKYRDGRFFFTFFMVNTIMHEIVYLTKILNHLITPDTYVLMFAVRMLIFPLLEILLLWNFRGRYLSVVSNNKKGWGFSVIFGGIMYVAIMFLMNMPTSITDTPEYLSIIILLFLQMPVMYMYMILSRRHQQRMYERIEQEKILQLQSSNMLARMEELAASNEKFREERHNFRHKMKTIASLVESQQYEDLEELLEEYQEALQKNIVVRYCKNAVIDAVLSAYIKKAEHKNIEVRIAPDFPDEMTVKVAELATALANAIENAIHACEKLPERKRFIDIKIISKPQFMIMIRNSFEGHVEFDDDGIPVSRDEGHGFGTRSIAAFCNKIGGYYQFKAENNIFTLYMHL